MESAVGLWKTVEQAIVNYTGLSAATFFTVLALAVAVYHVVSGFFQAPPPPRKREMDFEQMEPLPPPVQLGEISEEELSVYDGSDPKKPLLMAIKGQIYDVTQSRMFYGPGGPYALFAGKDASRALAKMSFEPADLTGDISGLGPFELEALQDWEYKFMSKYVKVGTVKKTVPVSEGSTGNTSETAEASSVQTTEEGQAQPSAVAEEDASSVDMHKTEKEHDIPVEDGAKAEPIGEHKTKEYDIPVENGAKAVHIAEHKEVGAGEDSKE